MSKQIKTALLVLGSVGLLTWGVYFLNGKNIFNSNNIYYAEYDNVEGLTAASPVTVNGLIVGKVSKIDLQNKGSLLVEIFMKKPIKVTKTTKVILSPSGLMGGKQLELKIDFDNPELAEDGAYLVSDVKSGLIDGLSDKVDPMVVKMDELIAKLNDLADGLNATLNTDTQKDLQSAIKELNQVMKNTNSITSNLKNITNKNEKKINNIVSNLNSTSTNVARFSQDLDKIEIEKIQQSINGFNSSITKLNTMLGDVENGNGNLGKLLKDEQLYINVESATQKMNELIDDLKLNPRKYINLSVFGKK